VGKVSVTPIFPFVVPKLTVMLLLLGPVAPDVIVDPEGTVHVYVDPEVSVTLYTIPVALQAGVCVPLIAEVTGNGLTVTTALPACDWLHEVVLASLTLTRA
jgi:hypothetical protein